MLRKLAAFLLVLMIMVGTTQVAEVKAATPSLTMEVATTSLPLLRSHLSPHFCGKFKLLHAKGGDYWATYRSGDIIYERFTILFSSERGLLLLIRSFTFSVAGQHKDFVWEHECYLCILFTETYFVCKHECYLCILFSNRYLFRVGSKCH